MAHALQYTQLRDTTGASLTLGTLWRWQATVLLFVRHFGCIFCREQLAEAEAHMMELNELGARLVVIGNGSPAEARAFAEEMGTEAEVLTDPERVSYCAVGMKRSVRSSLNLKTVTHGLRAWRDGHRQGAVAGDPFQQGGVVVMVPGGDEVFRFVSEEAGDHADFEDVLTAVRAWNHHAAAQGEQDAQRLRCGSFLRR
jgi:peroxiredoxin